MTIVRWVTMLMVNQRGAWPYGPTTTTTTTDTSTASGRGLFVYLSTTLPLHALVNKPLCLLTMLLGCGASLGSCAPVLAASSDLQYEPDYYSSDLSSSIGAMELGSVPEGEAAPGYRHSFHGAAPRKHMYEGVIICLLAVTAFIGLLVWVLKSNFEERQTRRMRREASLRDRNSNVSPLITPDSEES